MYRNHIIRKGLIKTILSITVVMIFMVSIAAVQELLMPYEVYAAQKLGKARITAVRMSGNKVKISWGKIRGAKKYQVYEASDADKEYGYSGKYWKYIRKIRASQKNKYSDSKKYKLKKAGKKYKLYKRVWKFYKVAATSKTSCTMYGIGPKETHIYKVRAINKSKKGKFSDTKKIKTGSATGNKGNPSSGDNNDDDDENEQTSLLPIPNKITGVSVTADDYDEYITLSWDPDKNANRYRILFRLSTSTKWSGKCTITGGSKDTARIRVGFGKSVYIKIAGMNANGKFGEYSDEVYARTTSEDEILEMTGKYSKNRDVAWMQYLGRMLGYYKEELAKRGVSIDSTRKEDEFQKLQAIIQVMHDRVGQGEKGSNDYTTFPTGICNWDYKNTYVTLTTWDSLTDEEREKLGKYYDGKEFLSTIDYYADCWTVADTECYLAGKAGLPAFKTVLGDAHINSGHVYAVIQANYIWYEADAMAYMYPNSRGLNYNLEPHDVSDFKEKKGLSCSYSKIIDARETTSNVEDMFFVYNVFSADAYSSNRNQIKLHVYDSEIIDAERKHVLFDTGTVVFRPQNAKYYSSDNSVMSFDNNAGTYTLNKPGTVYVTIVFDNLMEDDNKDKIPTYTTTVKLTVKE